VADISTLGKYEVRREIGRGAMGVVYEGYDPLIKRVVALKTIRPDQLAGEDSGTVIARFRREAQAAGRLSHPNIVSIHDFGEDAGVWFIAMEHVKGRELKECFDGNERFRTADVVRIMSQILAALDYSHRQGVIHRDIKPANIFLLDDGNVKVADFGIAHIDSSSLTQAGTVLGTPSYMSPEQILGLPVDGRSDLFSAGVILYQFLTGERPFAGSAATTMQKVLKEDPLPPSTLNVQVLPVMDAVVRKALAKRADDRFQSAQEFADAIRAAVPMAAPEAKRLSDAEPTIIAKAAPPALAAVRAVPDASPPPTPTVGKSPRYSVLATAIGIAAVAIAAGGWLLSQRHAVDVAKPAQPATSLAAVQSPAPPAAAPAPAPASAPVAAPASTEPGTLTIAAVGLVDPTDPRYQGDKALLQSELRADSRSQLVEKAVGLLVDQKSIAANYDALTRRVLANSGSYVRTVVRESEPRLGKDGLMSMTTEAVIDIKAVQKALNQMTRDERVELIRASGDPRVSVQIDVRDADRPDAPPIPSPVAENILKERIKSFGFRLWAEGAAAGAPAGAAPDFTVLGETRIRRLSMRLEASGLTVTKYALTSWTVRCVDRATGEEIYHNTTLPKGVGSWASEEDALKAIGTRIADEFSRDFFLQHANVAGRQVTLNVEGMPDAASEDLLARELVGLPGVIAVVPRPAAKPRAFDLQLAGVGAPGDLIAHGVLKPLNAKLGQVCFALGSIAGDQVAVTFDTRCGEPSVLSRLETNPPAGLYGSPPGRQKIVVKNPETLRKLSTI
jgi:tRNA A-37 threonylcarbamoyl transferase component Bud32